MRQKGESGTSSILKVRWNVAQDLLGIDSTWIPIVLEKKVALVQSIFILLWPDFFVSQYTDHWKLQIDQFRRLKWHDDTPISFC